MISNWKMVCWNRLDIWLEIIFNNFKYVNYLIFEYNKIFWKKGIFVVILNWGLIVILLIKNLFDLVYLDKYLFILKY